MALKDEKLITLDNLETLIEFLQTDIKVYTMAEYETAKATIPKNSFFVITDDQVSYSEVTTTALTTDDVDDLFDDTNSSGDPSVDDLF